MIVDIFAMYWKCDILLWNCLCFFLALDYQKMLCPRLFKVCLIGLAIKVGFVDGCGSKNALSEDISYGSKDAWKPSAAGVY